MPALLIRGGTHKQLAHLAIEFTARAIDCHVYTFAYEPSATHDELRRVRVHSLIASEAQLPWFVRVLTRRLGREKAIHYYSLLLARKFCRQFAGTEFDTLNPHDWYTAWLATRVRKRFLPRAKIIVMLNDMPPQPRFWPKRALINGMRRSARRQTDGIVVLDNSMRDRASAYYGKVPVAVVRSGLDIEAIAQLQFDRRTTRQELAVPEQAKLIVSAGILARHRRFEDAIRIVHQLRRQNVHLALLVGSPTAGTEYGSFLKDLVSELKLEARVHFVEDSLTFTERAAHIAASDALLFPNEHQTWGLTVIEAMAMGVPVIVSTGAGVHEVLRHGETGLVYPMGDLDELRRATESVLFNDEVALRLSSAGRAFALTTFSWERYASEMLDAFDGVAGAVAPRR